MHSELVARVAGLTDRDLLRQAARLAERERGATVELVGHLAELDARKLHVAEGYGSLFAYCTGPLRLAEHAAYNRIEAARLSRRFPIVLDLLADGSLNLSILRLLAPHLGADNFEALVGRARGRSKREVETLVAELAPQPDIPASVRRLPERVPTTRAAEAPSNEPIPQIGRSKCAFAATDSLTSFSTHPPTDPSTEPSLDPATDSIGHAAQSNLRAHPGEEVDSPPRLTARAVVEPLAPGRFRAQFTMSAATHDKLRRAQQLLRREIPDGNPSTIFDRALTLLLEDVARRKLAATSSPRPGQRMGTGSRHIPAHVRRTVWVRDGGQCAFVSGRGRRCSERVFLEFHHRGPYAAGGEATVDNISLHCRAHNAYEAELLFGTAAPHGNPLGDRRARAGPRGAKEARRGEAGVGSDASAGTRPGASCVRRGMGESVP